MRMNRVIAIWALLLGLSGQVFAQSVPQPEGYRLKKYDAPVPDEAPGAITVIDETAFALWRTGRVVIIDVIPDLKKPKNLPEDTIWKGRNRISIPGAHWWPGVGFGVLSAELETRFESSLVRVTAGDKTAPLMFLCRETCWMSWNAAKRAASYGYETVFWYSSGTSGWTAQDYPSERLKSWDAP